MLRPDIPFSRDDANHFLPWMIALMCGLAALMLLMGLSLNGWITSQHGDFGSRLIVQIPDHGPNQQAMTQKAVETLWKIPGAQGVQAMSPAEVGKLLSPWLGGETSLAGLPMPTVIEVALAPGAHGALPDYSKFTKDLQAISPDITLDSRALWVEKFSRFSRLMQTVIYMLAGTILAALAGMMVFAARASMKLHLGTVQLLHAIGAEDGYIARQFQRNARAMALRGALPGTLAAGLLYLMLSAYAAHVDAPLIPVLPFSVLHAAMLVVLPAACCVLAVAAVRGATLAQLRKML